ncbi:Outer membrane protein assembly factor BamB, contains PQQ-like beta-propeller repeat [Halomicrobium zhouii]|uniref:Outer membrane protein assembly factor BamB, contains PQQ-like beta-propeller repeat n=1 Tax=Halomicrobium zhouii TaxID=767519 RepID=A0A1I6M987_9EURY|nr:PQQ-like beta-propeller repeat protein [Halomicrobium zhouii]SFS12188.1 Outer membrane protein assembly factor BamB, contains PQQ-like beta-propeller repeat [Halomicrobium zhouii]
MSPDWSRRAFVATLPAAVAGCVTTPGTSPSDRRSESDGDAGSRTRTTTETPEDGVERLSADHPALAWAVKLPRPVEFRPAPGPGGASVYVGTGQTYVPDEGTEGPGGDLFALDAASGAVQWRARSDLPVFDRPLVHDGRVHVVTGGSYGETGRSHRVTAYDPDGSRRWQTDPVDNFLGFVAGHDGTVFAGTRDDNYEASGETLFALGDDGDVRWEQSTGDSRYPGTVVDGRLLHSAAGIELQAFDLETGETGWQVEGEPFADPVTPVAASGELCFTQPPVNSDEQDAVVARSTSDGAERWRYAGPSNGGDSFHPTRVVTSGEGDAPAVVGREYDGTTFALDSEGNELWTVTTDGDTYGNPVVRDLIYLSDGDGTITALDPADGTRQWQVSFADAAGITPTATGLLAHVDDENGRVVSLGRNGDERWRYEFSTATRRTAIATTDGRAYVGGADGTVAAFATVG